LDSLRGTALAKASQAAFAWRQRVGPFVRLPELITQLGGDPVAVLAAAGLGADSFAAPENRVPFCSFVQVLQVAAEQTACPQFGLLAGHLCSLDSLGVVGEVVRNAPTVGQALELLTVYQRINSDGGQAFLLPRGDFVDLGYAVYHPGGFGAAQVYDAALSSAMNLMFELCGPRWRPYEVLLSHSRPVTLAHHRLYFGVTPRFDSVYSALRIPARDLERPITGADPGLLRQAEKRAVPQLPHEFLQSVYRTLRLLMLEDHYSGDDLAHMLSMHRRTLNRRLKAQGTTFQYILDDVRYAIARELLANTEADLDDVAAALGYAGVTPFMRTFKRWSGTTPGHWRRVMRGPHAA
jgi:AraC-like DNA-binding protein